MPDTTVCGGKVASGLCCTVAVGDPNVHQKVPKAPRCSSIPIGRFSKHRGRDHAGRY
jgi:hypothetical protein